MRVDPKEIERIREQTIAVGVRPSLNEAACLLMALDDAPGAERERVFKRFEALTQVWAYDASGEGFNAVSADDMEVLIKKLRKS
jgi:hypothetical protein